MHGLGADAHDFEPIVPELRLPPELGIRFVFPNAPIRPVTVNGGMRMRAWYDVLSMDLPRQEDPDGVYASERAIYELLEREKKRGVPAERIVLAGFSQGGAMALHTALRYPDRLAGILALSCYHPLGQQIERRTAARQSANADLHGPRRLRRGDSDALRPAKRRVAGEPGLTRGMAGLRHGPRSVLGGNPRYRWLAGTNPGRFQGLNAPDQPVSASDFAPPA
jgi:phospholipase/carboxylesterase